MQSLNSIRLMVALCSLLIGFSVVAEEIYSGVVDVQGQTDQQRRAALPDAFEHVLRKLSGLRELPESEELDAASEGASSILLAYQYREEERISPEGESSLQLQLVAQFLPARMDQWVIDLGLPRWRVNRMPVVIWVLVDDGNSRELMPLEYQYAFDRMEVTALERGLPVAWPGLSEELKAEIDLQLLWGGYTEELVADGRRSEGLVIAAARREGPEWNVRWTYANEFSDISWRTRGTALEDALNEGAHGLVDRVATASSIAPSDQGAWTVELLIRDVYSSAAYARSLGYLEGLNLIDQVEVVGLEPQVLTVRLGLNASPDYLLAAFANDGVLLDSGVPSEFKLAREENQQ